MKEFGKQSKANGLLKIKIVAPHVKRTKKGLKQIKPYPRSR